MNTTTWTKEELEEAVKTSFSMAACLKKINLKYGGATIDGIKMKILYYGFDNSHWTGQGHNKGNRYSIKNIKNLMVENGNRSDSKSIKKYLIDELILPYECNLCAISDWQNNKLTLQIDHISGNPYDNRLQNLRLLCPNCHSQTETYAGGTLKNKVIVNAKKCNQCDKPLIAKRYDICNDCRLQNLSDGYYLNKYSSKTEYLLKDFLEETLISKVNELGFQGYGKELGVSKTALRNYYNKKGILYKLKSHEHLRK